MNSTAVESLQLAPPEERLLKRVVSPDPPGRLEKLFRRLVIIGLGFAILHLVVDLAPLAELRREGLQGLLFICLIFALNIGNSRVSLQERLIKKLYGELVQGDPNFKVDVPEQR